jgi:secretion/DNA translocation related TadE-like protein
VSRGRDERGSATLLVVEMVGLLLFIGAALSVVTAMVVAHRAAQAAADLAALAGARDVAGGGAGCARATQIAAANQARVTTCTVTGRVVDVVVEVEGPHWLGQTADFDAHARSGPAP